MIRSEMVKEEQVNQFSGLLSRIDIDNAGLGEYQLTYLKHLFLHKKYFLSIYAKVLNEVLNSSDRKKENIFLIDYGAGNGLLGLFAKYCGFGKIVQIDTSPGFHESQKILSRQLNIPIEEHILGDFEMLKKYSANPPNALTATDVIEHIYDLDIFLATLKELNENMCIIFTTASNDRNTWKKKRLMRIQHKDEWQGYDAENGNASILPFRKVRENMIKAHLPSITDSEMEQLVNHTRGLREDDIIKSCEIYKATKALPPLLTHPTNTCDPVSGSWTERFLSFEEYKNLFNMNGYALLITNGFYNHFQGGTKGKVLRFANGLINLLGKSGSRIAPYIMLSGTKLKSQKATK